ncbi:hypothetical protein NA57DRAFT_33330 [Rhizodiscina lignyota]|uniref:Uncharacterized protein n=1 Tax=Rhizodiscina lignyota TaxID=1504668 RepID=A0A9P4IL79_9PEZI|nr:hypothetical protein NA57DRAFT_33330 [Rhizodiscina lignyota]
MAKKKKSAAPDAANGTPSTASAPSLPPSPSVPQTQTPPTSSKANAKAQPEAQPSTSALIICRNKHWRYISSFHGPWLQLPPEVLESLAHSNYLSPRPHPIDPATFYDLVKIRRAVDEATDLAVRAQSGLTSAALSSSLNSSNGLLGAAGAAALGLGYGGTGGGAKLSRERKGRMRELASQKLSQAYHLDEIAASVATMQGASTLEDVAQLVLQRDKSDWDARYVHFFHEKIPSRMMAQCTPLEPLDRMISERPSDGSAWRTRALTRLFKEDWSGAVRDLTEGLAVARIAAQQHRKGKDQLILARTAREDAERRRQEWRGEVKVEEEDQPTSLEAQLLFHRAGVYLTIACQHVHAALDGLKEYEEARRAHREQHSDVPEEDLPLMEQKERDAQKKRLEARKTVKTNAKRALRDYTAFLSHFDYTPGLPHEIAEEFIRRVNSAANGIRTPKRSAPRRIDSTPSPVNGASGNSDALIPFRKHPSGENVNPNSSWPSLPTPTVYQVSQLFSPTPPPNLPQYPAPTSTALARPSPLRDTTSTSNGDSTAAALADSHEAITYHPLLTDALHSMLLCHSLLQTSPTELLRHAHNAARLARVCDGYPIFLAARSPSRADWVEVLRRAGNWIGLQGSWEALCRPAPLPTQSSRDPGSSRNGHANGTKKLEKLRKERLKHEAIMEALADERVVDEDSFQRAVQARRQRQQEDEEAEQAQSLLETSTTPTTETDTTASPPAPSSTPKRWAQDEGKEYPISTERAEAIARWVREAPLTVEGAKKKGAARKGKGKVRRAQPHSQASLEGRVQELDIDDEEKVDEEIE